MTRISPTNTNVPFVTYRGMMEAWDPKVSDMLLLKRALQNESFTFLKKQVEEKYIVYRLARMAEEKQDKPQAKEDLKDQINNPFIKGCLVTFMIFIIFNNVSILCALIPAQEGKRIATSYNESVFIIKCSSECPPPQECPLPQDEVLNPLMLCRDASLVPSLSTSIN